MQCQVCSSETTANKPFCIDHLDRLPYVQFLSSYVEIREHEIANAGTAVNLNGLLAAEILEAVARRGPMAIQAIAKALDVDEITVGCYATKLAKSDYAEIDGVVVHLTPLGRAHGRALQRFIS